MRSISEEGLEALAGSRAADRLTVDLWYDDQLVRSGLLLDDWTATADSTRQVQGQISASIVDPDGTLAPWSLSDPLNVGGGWLNLAYVIGTVEERIGWGWHRITRTQPVESWPLFPDGSGRYYWASRVPLDAEDLMRQAKLDRLDAVVPTGATVLAEVRNLMDGIASVVVDPEVKDRPLPSTIAYEKDRLDAIEDLLTEVEATYRPVADRTLLILPTTPAATPARTLVPGEGGMLVDLAREYSVDGLYNAVTSEATTEDGKPLVGRDFERSGPLRYGGPHGRVPLFHNAALAKTQAAVDADAATMLANRASNRSVVVQVTALPDPTLEVLDTVRVETPAGPIQGPATRIQMRGNRAGAQSMTVDVEVSLEYLEDIARKLRYA